MIVIDEYHAKDLLDNKEFDALVREYCNYNQMPNTNPLEDFDLNAYVELDERCLILVLKVDGKMVGMLALLLEYHMHTNSYVLCVDSYFVKPLYREGNKAGMLMDHAKEVARKNNIKNIICSAYHGSALEKVFFRKYKPLETWFIVEA